MTWVVKSFNLSLRFSRSLLIADPQRSDVSIQTLADELRVSYLGDDEVNTAIHLAQLEWVLWLVKSGELISMTDH